MLGVGPARRRTSLRAGRRCRWAAARSPGGAAGEAGGGAASSGVWRVQGCERGVGRGGAGGRNVACGGHCGAHRAWSSASPKHNRLRPSWYMMTYQAGRLHRTFRGCTVVLPSDPLHPLRLRCDDLKPKPGLQPQTPVYLR